MTNTYLMARLIPMVLLMTAFLVLVPNAALPAPVRPSAATPVEDMLKEARIAKQNAQAAYYRSQTATSTKQELPPWLNAVLPLAGVVLGSFLVHFFAARQSSEAQARLYERQKAQVRAAVRDLRATLEILNLDDNQKLDFLDENFLIDQPERPLTFSRSHPYYQKYDFVNLVYRLCAVLGWMELYRIDPTFLSGPAEEKRKIAASFDAIRMALSADFAKEKEALQVPSNNDPYWMDGVILNDDQRAIGETMLTVATKDAPSTVLGYGAFCDSLFRFAKKEGDLIRVGDQNFWIWNATRFIVDMGRVPPDTDFRRQRLNKALSELRSLSESLSVRKSGLLSRIYGWILVRVASQGYDTKRLLSL